MSWQPIQRKSTMVGGRYRRVACSVALGGKGGQRLIVSLLLSVLPKGWVPGARVAAAHGSDEDQGHLRLALDEAGCAHLYFCGARRSAAARHMITLMLPAPRDADADSCDGRRRVDVDHRWDGVALILGPLPDWACPDLSGGNATTQQQGPGAGRVGGRRPEPGQTKSIMDGPPPRITKTVPVTDRVIRRR